MSPAQINALFASLPTPYRFSPETLAYNFAYGWVVPSKDSPYEVIESNITDWIENLAEKHEIEWLEKLSDTIARHLDAIRSEEEEEDEDVDSNRLTHPGVEVADILANRNEDELLLDG